MRFLVPLAALVTAVIAATYSSGPASAGAACGHGGYSYAGYQSTSTARGVRADLVALAPPQVEFGHVAAWVGAGGPSQGGVTAWIQVGFATFGSDAIRLYFETNRPGVGPHYTEVQSSVAPGSQHRIAVLEMFGRPGWWRAWVDGEPISEPVYLAGSHGRWAPMATAETWDGGRPVCNRFMYRFSKMSIAGRGGAWRTFHIGTRFQDPGYRVIGDRRGFLARAVQPMEVPSAAMSSEPTPTEPPASTVSEPAAPEAAASTDSGS